MNDLSTVTDIPAPAKVAILFSGGRDSSLATCLLALKGYQLYLLSFISGIGVKSEVSDYRFNELKERFPQEIIGREIIPTFGLVRKVATLNIEQDFAEYKVNLILVGEKLAMHAAAIVFCLKHGITVIADGTSGYQQHFPEQMPIAVDILRKFHAEYGIDYLTPIADFRDVDSVKYTLMEMGITTKSLEGISVFAEAFSTPMPEVLEAYMNEKLKVCRQHISLMRTGDLLPEN